MSVPSSVAGEERKNSLNLIRLVLAFMVLYAHAFATAGRQEPTWSGRSPGTWAVAAFFAISGYLIHGSRMKLPFPTFIRHRAARIYPAYWACLIATVFIAFMVAIGREDVPLIEVARDGASYLAANASLIQFQGDIAHTTGVSHYPGVWNASLWTLPHEMACYLIIGLLLTGPLRRWPRMATLVTWLTSLLLLTLLPRIWWEAPLFVRQFSSLLPFFLGGSVVRAWGDQWNVGRSALVPIHLAIFVVATLAHARLGPAFAAASLCAGLIGLSKLLPSPPWVRRNDLSYGLYVYAFPISQALAIAGGTGQGFSTYVTLIVALTSILAFASWFLVERPALAWARR